MVYGFLSSRGTYGVALWKFTHKSMYSQSFGEFWIRNGIILAFGCVFIALAVIVLLSRNVTMPIRRLAETADKVYHDLSACCAWQRGLVPQLHDVNAQDDDLVVLSRR